ncbi:MULTISPECIES: DUF5808 domain-containing protein [Flavobacterium]|jgi:uncharacterized membrane protein|uniref:DUF5808 domain-containing protein n=1 Tax=Flavobacterium panici TaxID=2654843 RepID=A0A9N8P3J1_9FLAO|nr:MULTISPECIES: DUF5808 domain-containing protein [Flavobacterium]MDR6762555.1 putative membrane protein [Flavobacterium sp. 2755]CAC9976366.1 hypothetical protein FLAPXU55_04092 [Flavobacterium panici]
MNSEKPTQEDYDNWHKDPNNWYLFCFYYNPKDSRLFPPKRIPSMGYTINFANPFSALIILALLSIAVLGLLSR